jgi:hypothetical protein
LLDVIEPLGPLGAQLLWIAQPALGLLLPQNNATQGNMWQDIDGLARLLEHPTGIAWLRLALTDEPEDNDRKPVE